MPPIHQSHRGPPVPWGIPQRTGLPQTALLTRWAHEPLWGPLGGRGLSQGAPLAHRFPEKPRETSVGGACSRVRPPRSEVPEKSLGLRTPRLPQSAPLAWVPPTPRPLRTPSVGRARPASEPHPREVPEAPRVPSEAEAQPRVRP